MYVEVLAVVAELLQTHPDGPFDTIHSGMAVHTLLRVLPLQLLIVLEQGLLLETGRKRQTVVVLAEAHEIVGKVLQVLVDLRLLIVLITRLVVSLLFIKVSLEWLYLDDVLGLPEPATTAV